MSGNKTSSARETLLDWIDAFNHRDVDRIMAFYADDAVNFQVAAGEPRKGTREIRDDFQAFFSAFPDVYAKVEHVMADGDWAAWEWLGGGTFLGHFLGQGPTGRRYELRGCGFFKCKDGLIVLQRGYWDKETWFLQIGISE